MISTKRSLKRLIYLKTSALNKQNVLTSQEPLSIRRRRTQTYCENGAAVKERQCSRMEGKGEEQSTEVDARSMMGG
jgi:hypothetical protein